MLNALFLFVFSCFLLVSGGAVPASAQNMQKAVKSWVVCYSDTAPVFELMDYDLVVLDSKYHPDLRPLQEGQRTVLGYISLGEVEKHRDWFNAVKEQGLLGQENPNWPGSYYVDVRSPLWTKRVIEELVPRILQSGFDGIFIDTLDNPVYLEEIDSTKNAGMTEAAANLVKAIARHYPDMPIMLNRAYKLLPEVGGKIAFALGESVYSGHNFETGEPHLQTDEDYRYQVQVLQKAKRNFPQLQVMTLDYWNPEDSEKVQAIYAKQRANGFVPYVSTVKLDKIIAEPQQ